MKNTVIKDAILAAAENSDDELVTKMSKKESIVSHK
jgi:hypothetical protein